MATHDPRREQAWELLTVDGREPTSDEREEVLSERSRERGEDEDDEDDEDGARSMVSPGSVALVDETDERWLGMTFPKDRGRVRAGIRALVDAGAWPGSLLAASRPSSKAKRPALALETLERRL